MAGTVSVIVPVYDSEGSLPLLVERLNAVFLASGTTHEIILVNDGSRDASWRVIESLVASHRSVRGINLMRNYGQHNALLCGIRAARHEITVTIDDDLQNPPEEIPGLLAELERGYDVVYGAPESETHGLWRDLASRMTKIVLQGTMGVKTARRVSSFRAIRTATRAAFSAYRGPFVSIDVLLTWGTSRFSAVVVKHSPRSIGRSNYTLRKLITHALNMMTGFSTVPLQVASLAGFAFMFFGIGVLVYAVGRYLIQGTTVQGFPFLASVIAIFSGVQLFALGMIGEYLARMHFRMMERPSYAVRQEIDDGQPRRAPRVGQ